MLRLHQRRNTCAGGCTFFSAEQLANRTGVLCQIDLELMQSVEVSSHSLDSRCLQDTVVKGEHWKHHLALPIFFLVIKISAEMFQLQLFVQKFIKFDQGGGHHP